MDLGRPRPFNPPDFPIALGSGSDGLVRLPQLSAVGATGEVIAPGSVVDQAEHLLVEAERRLERHGLDLSHVVRTVDQSTLSTRGDYRGTGRARAERLGPAFPASTGVISPTLLPAGALLVLDVWASSLPKQVVNPGWPVFDFLTFSPAVRVGDVMFTSGTTAFDPATGESLAQGDVVAQAGLIYDAIATLFEAAGGSAEHVVHTIEYVTPAACSRYAEVAAVRDRKLGKPTSTAIPVQSLLSRDWLIEVEAVGHFPPSDDANP